MGLARGCLGRRVRACGSIRGAASVPAWAADRGESHETSIRFCGRGGDGDPRHSDDFDGVARWCAHDRSRLRARGGGGCGRDGVHRLVGAGEPGGFVAVLPAAPGRDEMRHRPRDRRTRHHDQPRVRDRQRQPRRGRAIPLSVHRDRRRGRLRVRLHRRREELRRGPRGGDDPVLRGGRRAGRRVVGSDRRGHRRDAIPERASRRGRGRDLGQPVRGSPVPRHGGVGGRRDPADRVHQRLRRRPLPPLRRQRQPQRRLELERAGRSRRGRLSEARRRPERALPAGEHGDQHALRPQVERNDLRAAGHHRRRRRDQPSEPARLPGRGRATPCRLRPWGRRRTAPDPCCFRRREVVAVRHGADAEPTGRHRRHPRRDGSRSRGRRRPGRRPRDPGGRGRPRWRRRSRRRGRW